MNWIDVDKELPDIGKWVLIRVVCGDYFNIEQGMYRGDGNWMNCWCATRNKDLYPITHWMPLPAPPSND